MLDMYRVKKKRPVDPNAPPRPNLLNHEKRIKETSGTLDKINQENQDLRRRVDSLESKLLHQTEYLNALHRSLQRRG